MWDKISIGLFGSITLLWGSEFFGVSNVRGIVGTLSEGLTSFPAIGPDNHPHHAGASVSVSGFNCDNGYGRDLNQEYVFQGLAADGRPYYRGITSRDHFIYYDAHCASDTPEPRWLLGGKPNPTLIQDLNQADGSGCNNDFSIVSNAMWLPAGFQRLDWQWCRDHGLRKSWFWGGASTVNIRYAEGDVPPNGGLLAKATSASNVEVCAKYDTEFKVKACEQCSRRYPSRRDRCLKCGGRCVLELNCDPAHVLQCVKRPSYHSCHLSCMDPPSGADGVPSDSWVDEHNPGYPLCSKANPDHPHECMDCGRLCWQSLRCDDHPHEFMDIHECMSNPKFGICHKKCLYGLVEGSKDKTQRGRKATGTSEVKGSAEEAEDGEEEEEEEEEQKMARRRNDECTKYKAWGARAMSGCHKCQEHYDGQVKDCMNCGMRCFNDRKLGRLKNETKFMCHTKCMTALDSVSNATVAPEVDEVGDAAV